MIKKILTLLLSIGLVFCIAAPTYAASSSCGGTKTQLVACDGSAGTAALGGLISIAVSILSVLIGVVATGGLAYAAVIYASARDDQTKVSEARGIIRNVIVGLLLYALTIAIVNWLVPGGIISGGAEQNSGTGASTSPTPTATPLGSTSPTQ